MSNFYSSGELFDKLEVTTDYSLSSAKKSKKGGRGNGQVAPQNATTTKAKKLKHESSSNSKAKSSSQTASKRAKNVVPLGWTRLIRGEVVCYTSPSGVELCSLQAVKSYLLSENTCKCGLECPLNVNDVFSFDPAVKQTNAKLTSVGSKHYRCAVFKTETSLLRKIRKKLGSCAAVSPMTASTTVVAQSQSVIKKKRTALANKSNETTSDESFDESKLSHLLGYLNGGGGDDTSNSFDLSKSSCSQVQMSIFNTNEAPQHVFASNSLTDNFYNMKMSQIDYNSPLNFDSNDIYVNLNNCEKSNCIIIL